MIKSPPIIDGGEWSASRLYRFNLGFEAGYDWSRKPTESASFQQNK